MEGWTRLFGSLTNNTTLPSFGLLLLRYSFAATPPSMMPGISGLDLAAGRHTVPHQHTGPSSGFKDIVNAFDFQCGAFFICSSADGLSCPFTACSGHPRARVVWGVWVIHGGTKIRFAANKDDGNCCATDRAYLFYPFIFHVVQRVWGVQGKGYEYDMGF